MITNYLDIDIAVGVIISGGLISGGFVIMKYAIQKAIQENKAMIHYTVAPKCGAGKRWSKWTTTIGLSCDWQKRTCHKCGKETRRKINIYELVL